MNEHNEGLPTTDTGSENSPPKTVSKDTSGTKATDKETLQKLIDALKNK